MNARVQEKKYGGYTAAELRALVEHPTTGYQPGKDVLKDLLDEIEAAPPREVADRLRRIETKLTKVAIKTGAEPGDGTTMTILAVRGRDGGQFVEVPGYDVTLSAIRKAAVDAELDTTALMRIVDLNNRLIATLKIVDREG